MLQTIINLSSEIASLLWGPWTMILIAFVSIYLSIRSGFFQMRKFGFIMKNTLGKIFEKPERETKAMTPFQATSTAMASTIGMGNIAGVATALSVGGPGAIFWMWLLAFLGMMSKTAEITLAVHYRDVDKEGNIRGGPMYYIEKGLGWKPLSKLFSIGIFINSILATSTLQPHTVGRAFLSSYNTNPYLVAGIMSIITGLVVIGGIKRIGKFSERVVPVMSVVYILAGIGLFIVNYDRIPDVFALIFKYAFAPMPAAGGFAGAAISATIQAGMARGMLSNEAGEGTAPMAHATANTKHPFQQGIWGTFEVFMDTMVICTITSFAVLSTGVLSTGESGIELVMVAFSSVYPKNIVDFLLSFTILSFCLTTQIGFFIYYETSAVNVFGKRSMKYLRWFYLIPGIIFAGITNVDQLWVFADISVAACSIPNLIAVLALSGAFFKLMKDYFSGKNEYATKVVDFKKNYVKIANLDKS